MARGNWVIMFPEGTRTPRGDQGSYKGGASRLAVATGQPIVPIAVVRPSAGRAGALSQARRDRHLDRPPDPVAGRQPDELMREVEAWIGAEMRHLDPQAYPSGRIEPAPQQARSWATSEVARPCS